MNLHQESRVGVLHLLLHLEDSFRKMLAEGRDEDRARKTDEIAEKTAKEKAKTVKATKAVEKVETQCQQAGKAKTVDAAKTVDKVARQCQRAGKAKTVEATKTVETVERQCLQVGKARTVEATKAVKEVDRRCQQARTETNDEERAAGLRAKVRLTKAARGGWSRIAVRARLSKKFGRVRAAAEARKAAAAFKLLEVKARYNARMQEYGHKRKIAWSPGMVGCSKCRYYGCRDCRRLVSVGLLHC